MKISAYIISVDSGFAPNPFGKHCTLACCKPSIRRSAEVGDIIIGTAATHYPKAGYLIYAMRVSDVLTYQQYWDDPRYNYRKSSLKTQITKRGDNIWHCDKGEKWVVVPEALHDLSHRKRDISGENVLVSTDFYYFGRDAIPVPRDFSDILATTQGHKNTTDVATIKKFWDWLSTSVSKSGRLSDPSEFTEKGCSAQNKHKEAD